MRAVVQRVRHGAVSVADPAGGREELGRIDADLVILVGVRDGDGDEEARWLAGKVANLRIFEDDAGKFNRSLPRRGRRGPGGLQFTSTAMPAAADAPRSPRRPRRKVAAPLIDRFCEYLRREGGVARRDGALQAPCSWRYTMTAR